jgi:CHAT domain-containing protein/tetratricopeptide (TPR) repeat protein
MKKLKLTFLLSSLCFALCLNAQSLLPKAAADSLWNIWNDPSQLDTLRLQAINKYAWSVYLFNQPDSAFCYAQLQYEFAKSKGLKKHMAVAINTQGTSFALRGDYTKAIDYFSRSLNLQEEIGDKQGMAWALNNIGLIYKNQGDYAHAIDYYTRSLRIIEERGDKKGMAGLFNNIGTIYKIQGDYAHAIDYYTSSLKIYEEMGNKQGIAGSLGNIGTISESQGDDSKAIEYYTRSFKISEEIADKKGIAISFNNIGQVYVNQGDYDQAIDYFTQSLKIKDEINSKLGIAMSLNNIGRVFQITTKYTEAIETLHRAYAISTQIGDDEDIRLVATSLHRTYTLTDSLFNAYRFLSTLLERRNQNLKTNFFTLSEKEKQSYFSTMEADYSLYHDFALNFQNHIGGYRFENVTDTSFNIALQNKGLTLKSSTAMRSAIQNSGDTTLIKEYENWLTLKKKIANLNETDSMYKDLVTQANEMERELVKTSTVFSDFDKVKNLKWQDVQTGLKPNEAAIEFVHFKSEIDTTNPIIYAALIIKKDSKHPEMIRLCSEVELKEILGVFQGNNLSFVKGVYGTRSKAEKALYEKIWQPLEKHLEGIQNIYYSPSGLLHKVSFAAISKDINVFLCDNYQLHQQSSTGKVALPSNVMYDAKDAYLLMGGVQYNTDKTKKEVWSYLPGTLNETDNIQSFLEKKKHSVNLFAANEANESNFKTQASKANVLHISTHGFFFPDPEQVKAELDKDFEEINENIQFRGTEALDSAERSSSLYANWSFVINKNPLMRSGLVLAGANDVWQRNVLEEGEDGILTAQEVSNLDLRNTKLVVLSACETGLGDIKGSEGVFGLQRAFKMAGAEYLIMSLWQVPDKETAEFMELFYKNLVKVKDIPKAFNLTQQVMRKKYDPYYWASFVLIN